MLALLAPLNKISVKIPAMLIVSALVASLAIGLNSYWNAASSVLKMEEDLTESIARYRARVLAQVGENLAIDVGAAANNPAVKDAFDFIDQVYDPKLARSGVYTRHYVERQAASAQQKAEYLGDDDKTSYAIGHKRWHPVLQRMAKDKQLYDLFLINISGEVIYTYFKEPDFATNVKTGPWKETGLARVFEGAIAKASSGKPHFEDFQNYGPSNNEPAAFIGQAILADDGKPIGVVAFQLPTDRITASIHRPFGNTGAVYAVGSDGRLRSNLEIRGKQAVFTPTAHAEKLKLLQQQNATHLTFKGPGIDGAPSLITAAPLEFIGTTWYLVADDTEAEVYAPLYRMGQQNALIALLTLAGISFVSIFAARRLSKPIQQMRDAVGDLASGEDVEIPGLERRDELGELAQSLKQVHAAGVAAAQIKSALDCASVNVMVADPQGKIVYCNPAMLEFFREHAREFHQQFPTFSAEQMIGATIDQFHRSSGWKDHTVNNARIPIGNLTLELRVNQIRDAKGAMIGMITEWHDVTAELASMTEVTRIVDAAARGDFSGRIREDNKVGAMRDLAAGQNRINGIVEQAMEDFTTTLHKVAEGDLVVRVNAMYEGRFAQLATGINDTVGTLSETVATIQRSARNINRSASEITSGATDLAKRTESEASNLEETAATTEELAASVKQTADNSRQAQEMSDKARGLASQGGQIVQDAISAMERIEDASRRINEIISVIDDIAFQTNLLALNAAVEAARAGDAGKGFAVVASEVRTLAQRSGQAANDIKTIITGSSAQVVDGVRLVRATGSSLKSIVTAADEVAQMVSLIHAAAAEQAHGIEDMSTAVARIDEMTQQNSALAEESAASATELMRQIDQLNQLVSAFRIDAARVLAEPVRAPAAPVAPSTTEPDRLRQLAAEAFAQSRVTPAPARSAASSSQQIRTPQAAAGGRTEWAEF